jgi:DNA-binding CsgD family transcriptional regulator
MGNGVVLGSREQRMMGDLHEALGASLDLHAVLKDAYRLLLPLVGADYGALAATPSDGADEYEWIVQDLPSAFLGSYEEMAPHDFVNRSVLAKINVVVRDAEMIDRRAFERNMMYHRARELGSPIEQVMAVMLHAGDGLQSGLSLYRDRRRPFSERDQRILQQLAPAIANAVRNCRSSAKAGHRGTLLDRFLESEKGAVVFVRFPAREIDRTALATAVLDAWFTPVERVGGSLPRVLLDELAKARAARMRGDVAPWLWKRERSETSLKVEFRPLPGPVDEPVWAVVLREVSRRPPAWEALLTKREREVASRVRLGWDTELIAQDLGNGPNTVKKQLQSIYKKLDVPDRKRLILLLCETSLDK